VDKGETAHHNRDYDAHSGEAERSRAPTRRTQTGGSIGIPYDCRVPTVARPRATVWNPANPSLLTPHAVGVGWSSNVYRVLHLTVSSSRSVGVRKDLRQETCAPGNEERSDGTQCLHARGQDRGTVSDKRRGDGDRERGLRGISDAAVQAKTGKGWDEWGCPPRHLGATEKGHTRSAAYLREKHGVSPWWAQAVTARYEWARGLRQEPHAETLEQGGELGRPAGGDVL